jgi:hypothetical protein
MSRAATASAPPSRTRACSTPGMLECACVCTRAHERERERNELTLCLGARARHLVWGHPATYPTRHTSPHSPKEWCPSPAATSTLLLSPVPRRACAGLRQLTTPPPTHSSTDALPVTDKGQLYMWGSAEAGRLGNGLSSDEVRRSPKPVPAFYYVNQARCLGVSVGPYHALAISSTCPIARVRMHAVEC